MGEEMKIEVSDPTEMLPGIRKTKVNDNGTIAAQEGKGRRVDFAAVVYDDSFSWGGAELPVVKDRADMGIWGFIADWKDTFLKRRKVRYVTPGHRKYAEYEAVRSLVQGFGYEGVRALARAYWTLPRWQNYERTVERFAQHGMAVYEDLQRRKRDG